MKKTIKVKVPGRPNGDAGSIWHSVVIQQYGTCTEESTMFSQYDWSQMIQKEVVVRGAGDWWSSWTCSALQVGLGGPRIASESFFSKMLASGSFWFPWVGMALFFACPVPCRMAIVDQDIVPGHYSPQKVVNFCFVLSQVFLAGVHASLLQFGSNLSRHPPCRHFVELQHVVHIWWTEPWPTSNRASILHAALRFCGLGPVQWHQWYYTLQFQTS
jgi:hypothetical protein